MSKPKNIHAVELGRIGGKNGKGKSKARTTEQARSAAMKRWNKGIINVSVDELRKQP